MGRCPICLRTFQDVYEHARKAHGTQKFTPQLAIEVGGMACKCGKLVKSKIGHARHKSQSGCTEGLWVLGGTLDTATSESSDDVGSGPQAGSGEEGTTSPDHVSESMATPAVGPSEDCAPSESSAVGSGANSGSSHCILDLVSAPALAAMPSAPPWVSAPLIPAFTAKVASLSEAYVNDPSEESLALIMGLPKIGFAPTLTQSAVGKTRERLEAYPSVAAPEPLTGGFASESTEQLRTKKAVRQVERGKLSRALRILSATSKVLPLSTEVVARLKELHPSGPSAPFPDRPGNPFPTIPEEDVLNAVKSFAPDTACGPSGWSVNLVKLALRTDQFRKFLTTLVQQIAQGTAPGRDLLCAATLTPLAKPNGGVRPIAVGEIFYRTAMKVLVKRGRKSGDLLPNQLGVGTPCGVEPIAQAIEEFTTHSPFCEHTRAVVSLDIRNAFNTLDRKTIADAISKYNPRIFRAAKWAYGAATPLIVQSNGKQVILQSSQGVRQGCPLGPYLFSLGFRERLAALTEASGDHLDLALAYLDDVTLLSKQVGLLDKVVESWSNGPADGLELNLQKSTEKTAASINATGLETLGTCIGPASARRTFLQDKVDSLVARIKCLETLPHQHALLLLRQCIAQELRHLLRSMDGTDLGDIWNDLDLDLQKHLAKIRNAEVPGPNDDLLFTLPTDMGGLGVLSHSATMEHARAASKEACTVILNAIRSGTEPVVVGIESQRTRQHRHLRNMRNEWLETASQEDRLAVVDNCAKIARAWLRAIPREKQRALTDREISIGLQLRTLTHGRPRTAACRLCGTGLSLGHDESCTGAANQRLARHELLKKALNTLIKSNKSTTTTLEPFLNQQTSGLRADIKAVGPATPVGGTTAYIDLSVVSLHSSLSSAAVSKVPRKAGDDAPQTAGETVTEWTNRQIVAAIKVREDAKVARYEKICPATFAPMVMTSSGRLSLAMFKYFEILRKGLKLRVGEFTMKASLILLRSRAVTFGMC